MALIIKGDMPTKGCADCPLKRYWEGNPWTYGYACFITSRDIDKEIKEGVFHESCPIIGEIPDEHGDLIDRKALSDAIGKVITDRDRMIGTYDTIEQIIDEAETIVEASNE